MISNPVSIEELYEVFRQFPDISTDTRKLIPGSIFFALKGDHFDGNRYALEAIEKGCSYAVVDDPGLPSHERILLFPDVLGSLQKLARHHRDQLNIPVIGITGSNGKTTTKELISCVLSRKYKVCATQGNLNNHIGVPLTVLSVRDHEIAIIEMGANHIGEIAMLCNIAVPGFGIITNIGKAHLEGFGSPEGVIQAKSELFDHLAGHKSVAFVDSENPLLCRLAAEKKLDPVFYGNSTNTLCSGKTTSSSKFLEANINFPPEKKELEIKTSLVGNYNLRNVLAAAGIGRYFDVSPGEIALAINGYKPSNNRSQLMDTGKNKIVLDAYNANPDSMEGAINNFLSMAGSSNKLIILGDMLELGKYSIPEHMSIVANLSEKQIENIIFVGPEFYSVTYHAKQKSFLKVEDLIEHLRSEPVIDHLILLKGSRGIRLEKLLEVL